MKPFLEGLLAGYGVAIPIAASLSSRWARGVSGGPAVRRSRRRSGRDEGADLRTYLQFIGLTIINPLTVAYLAAFVLGRGAAELSSWPARAAFVAGFALASLSWQTLLAAFGAVTHRFLPARAQVLVSILGNLLVVGLGARMLLRSFA